MGPTLRITIVCSLAFLASPNGALGFALEDIQFWVGAGRHRAGLAIDWDGDNLGGAALPSLAWGYRWDGERTVEDALRAIVAADERLFAKLGPTLGLGTAAYGLGYDANDDGAFALDDDTQFDVDGFATSGAADGALSLDAADAYREGWDLSFWHLAQSAAPEAVGWTTSGSGVSMSGLSPEGWSSLAHTPSFSLTAFADDLVAAAPPTLPGDFNFDGLVDAADYAVWRGALGDVDSYLLWRSQYGASTTAMSAMTSLPVPEPALGMVLFIVALLIHLWGERLRPRCPRHLLYGAIS